MVLKIDYYRVSVFLFCLSYSFVYLLYFCLNWTEAMTKAK